MDDTMFDRSGCLDIRGYCMGVVSNWLGILGFDYHTHFNSADSYSFGFLM